MLNNNVFKWGIIVLLSLGLIGGGVVFWPGQSGVSSNVDLDSNINQESYSFGVLIGQNISNSIENQFLQIDVDAFIVGVADQLYKKPLRLTPENIQNSVLSMQNRAVQAQKNFIDTLDKRALTVQDKLFADDGSPVSGNAKAKIIIVEFFDYNCGYCKNMGPILKNLLKKNKQIKVIYRHFPVLYPSSKYAAKAMLAAKKYGKDETLHQAFLQEEERLNTEKIENIIKQAGIDVEQFKKDMADPAVDELLGKNLTLAKEIGFIHVPTFFVARLNNENKAMKDKLFHLESADQKTFEDIIKALQAL